MVPIPETKPARTYTSLRNLDWRIVLGLFALNTLCLFFYRQLDFAAYGFGRSPMLTFGEEGIGGLAGLIVFPLIYLTAIRFPLLSPKWRSNLLAHLIAVCLISVLHTTLIAILRSVLFPLLGFGNESYGSLAVRYPMEFSHLFIYYWFAVSLIYLFHEIRFARERELRQAKLESSLAQTQLQNLRLQLEPHFLFNALNAISAAIYEHPRVADEMIGRLGELLRRLLKEDRSQLVSLANEVEALKLYTGIMEARLEDRLVVSILIDPAAGQALVPQLILQPLVENAIRHGIDSQFQARIEIGARCERDTLYLTVRDHGSGLDHSNPLEMGIGLRNTTERLQRLYGAEQQFEIRNAPGGGALAEVRIPFRLSGPLESQSIEAEAGVR